MYAFIHFADNLSAWFGKAFGWLIMLMTFGVSYEVFVRDVLNEPTPWALDVSFIMYGTLFMMGGAYTLGKNGHVRGDFLYRNWKPSTQARVDLILYFHLFLPWSFGALDHWFQVRSSIGRLWGSQYQQPVFYSDFPVQSHHGTGGCDVGSPRNRSGVTLHSLYSTWFLVRNGRRKMRLKKPKCS